MDINRANRQVADVLIQEKKTKALFRFFFIFMKGDFRFRTV